MAATDPNSALRAGIVAAQAEIGAAQAVVEQMILGLQGLIAMAGQLTPPEPDLVAALNAQLVDCQRRAADLQTVMNDMSQTVTDLAALQSDGYPALNVVSIAPSTAAELVAAMANLQAASGIFSSPAPVAAAFNSNAPHTDVPQPVPSQS